MTFDPSTLSPDTIAAIQAHAMRDYPNESCGAITPDGYHPLRNLAREAPGMERSGPKFNFDCDEEMRPLQASGDLLALVHSHPDGPYGPSALDIRTQQAMDVPWGIVVCTPEAASVPYWWGDAFEPPALIGREFRHGPSGTDGKGDCYALIRDWHRIERGVVLQEGFRDDSWWNRPPGADGCDLYSEHYLEAGFSVVLDRSKPQVGDVILMSIAAKGRPNHGGIYAGGGMMIHHLHGRVSRLEPIGHWLKLITHWLRHESAP